MEQFCLYTGSLSGHQACAISHLTGSAFFVFEMRSPLAQTGCEVTVSGDDAELPSSCLLFPEC